MAALVDAAAVFVFNELLVFLTGFFRDAGPRNSTLLTLPSLSACESEFLEFGGFLLAEKVVTEDTVFLAAFAEDFFFFAAYSSEEE
jgi:hypothetical protein